MSVSWRNWRLPAIALLAIASSGIGILNQFTYDDRYIVELNPATHTLHRWWRVFATSYWPKDWGGDGYRPLTILAYKIEWALAGPHAALFHAVNIALYAACAVLVYLLARRLLPGWAAWIAAALFAVHPVHVEAVAGVVGQAELLVAVALLASMLLYLRDRATGGPLQVRTGAAIALLYAVACFSKEHGIVLPVLLAAIEGLLVVDPRRWRERVARIRPFYLVLTLIAVAFVAVRSRVLEDHGVGGFQPFMPFATLHITGFDRALTALGVVPQWLRLFYWPARLSADYGPPEIAIAQGPALWQIPGFLLLVAILALGVILRRTERVISFGIAIVVITLLPSSNFLIPAGIVLAERTLFLPSVGAMLVLGAVLVVIARQLRDRNIDTRRVATAGAVALCALLLAGVVRSSSRTTVWRSNEALFSALVTDAPLEYRAHYMLGAWNFEQKRKREGEAEYRKALSLFPYDPYLSYNLAEQYRTAGLCAPALPLYKWTHELDPKFPMGHGAYAWCLLNEGQYADAKVQAYAAIRNGGSIPSMRRVLFIADSAAAADSAKAASDRKGARKFGSGSPDSLQITGRTVQKLVH